MSTDHGVPAVRVKEMGQAVAAGTRTFDTIDYSDQGSALRYMRDGKLNSVLTIPPTPRRVLARATESRAHRRQHRHLRLGDDDRRRGSLGAYNAPTITAERVSGNTNLDVVESIMRRIQYLLPGSIVNVDRFMMVMIGGGIVFIDDKARGLHEGYLVTPITRFELIAGFNLSGTIKAVMAGIVLMTVGR